MADPREIAQARRRRNGKQYRISKQILEIKQLISENCAHTKLKFLGCALSDDLTLAQEQHEILMSLLQTDDPEYDDVWISELTVDVYSCLIDISTHIDNHAQSLAPPEILITENTQTPDPEPHYVHESTEISFNRKVECNLDAIPAEPSDSFELDAIQSNPPLESEATQDDVSKQMSTKERFRTRFVLLPEDARYDMHLIIFAPVLYNWIDKLKRDTEVARQFAGWWKFSTLQFSYVINGLKDCLLLDV